MPHVEVNRLLLKICLRKRPFNSEEDASAEHPELFEVYQCPICQKWHRASKPKLKAERRKAKRRHKQLLKIAARKKRRLLKHYNDD